MDHQTHTQLSAILDAPSIYPERERKPHDQRERDLIDWLERYGEVNEGYNMYGLDLADAPDCHDYLDGGAFRKQRYDVSSVYLPAGCEYPWNMTTVMRDKVQFEAFADLVVGPERHCHTFGIITTTGYFGTRDQSDSFEDLIDSLEGGNVVVKPAYGASGGGVIVARVRNGCITTDQGSLPASEFLQRTQEANHPHLVQRYIEQHPFMKQANPTSVNTVRIVSWHTGDAVRVNEFASLRFGKPGSPVDNSNAGGNIMAIDSTGTIGPDAFNFYDRHRFEAPLAGQSMPFWNEIRSFVERLHSLIPGLFTVGWDIALTDKGPFVIEGNDSWEPHVTQLPPGCGQRNRWNSLLAQRQRFFDESSTTGFVAMDT